jgi:hypothetical protein
MYPVKVSLSVAMLYTDCAYRNESSDVCSDAGTKALERSKGVSVTRVVDLVEKIPAWVGTIPHATRTTAKEAQKTGQCLGIVSLPFQTPYGSH